MLHLSASRNYYFCNIPTDMRKGFDSLGGLVAQHMKLDVLSGSIFIFINRKRDQVKLLLWEGDGFSIYYKRLERGTYEQPVLQNNQLQISHQQLQFILQGIQLQSIKMKKRYQQMSVNKIA
jgi:transposase